MDMNLLLAFVRTAAQHESSFNQVMTSQLSAALIIIFGLICLKVAAKEKQSQLD
jgi:hypothetical protein